MTFDHHQLGIKIKSPWMVVQFFQDWFFEEFVLCIKKFLRKIGLPEKALILVDHTQSPSHPKTTSFLLCNMMSIIQPMDQWVIVSFKQNYQNNLLQKI